MQKTVAVILSGCGVFDGSEIYESALTVLHLQNSHINVKFFAPDIEQSDVIDHTTGNATLESRQVLNEAARIARGEIKPLADANIDDLHGAIFPGGSGAAKNLCDFAQKQAQCRVHETVKNFILSMHHAGKPLGFICIAPVIAAQVIGNGVALTIGNDKNVANTINKMGGTHKECPVDEFIIDENKKILSTPAYMLAQNVPEVSRGIEKLVDAFTELL